ncbi:DUF6714 family protein [Undibacterium sp. TC4M20W]|uniref:DUF6714 family protein n=1 Tax=Undibacterium sp. TC4M20W TaxID=3413052 RepID=UPI003BF0F120
MSYPTQQDIDAMRASGYEAVTIAPAQARQQLGERASALKQAIHLAFADVQLGDGTGLHEAQGLDDYEDAQTCAAYREKDEKTDWRRISLEDMNLCCSSLSFFDAAGMRFHLPAFMQGDLDYQVNYDLIYHLTQSVSMEDKFALLDDAQRAVVVAYLNLRLDDEDYRHEWEHAFNALLGYWNE